MSAQSRIIFLKRAFVGKTCMLGLSLLLHLKNLDDHETKFEATFWKMKKKKCLDTIANQPLDSRTRLS